ncbi:MAG: hypothetical protein WBF34_33030 [Streptosporangiaceae bacterium]
MQSEVAGERGQFGDEREREPGSFSVDRRRKAPSTNALVEDDSDLRVDTSAIR